MRLLRSKTDSVKIEVYCWEVNDEIEATCLKKEIPQKVETETINFTFRKPGYIDSNRIIKKSNFKVEGEETSLDVNSFQENILTTLLIDWDLKDEDGKDISFNISRINLLVPNVARAAIAGVLEKIKI